MNLHDRPEWNVRTINSVLRHPLVSRRGSPQFRGEHHSPISILCASRDLDQVSWVFPRWAFGVSPCSRGGEGWYRLQTPMIYVLADSRSSGPTSRKEQNHLALTTLLQFFLIGPLDSAAVPTSEISETSGISSRLPEPGLAPSENTAPQI